MSELEYYEKIYQVDVVVEGISRARVLAEGSTSDLSSKGKKKK